MSTLIRIAGVSLCVALHFMWSAPARAQSKPPLSEFAAGAEVKADSAKADSLKAAADSLSADSAQAPVDRFTAVSTSRVESNEIYVAIGSGLIATIDAGRGWKFTHNLGMERKRYRQRKMEDITEHVLNQADKVHPGLYKLGMQVGENYSKMKTLGLGRYGLDIIFDNTNANLEFSVLKPLLHSSKSDLTVKAEGSKGTNDFKYNRVFSGTARGMLSYAIGDLLAVEGGAEASGRRETSYVGRNRFGPMPSNTNSARAAMSYGRDSTKTVEVSYRWLKGVDREVTPPRGNTYEVLNDPSQAKREEERNREEQLTVKASLEPFSFLTVKTSFGHAKAIKKYRVDTGLSMEQEENSIDADASYSYAARGSLQFGVSTSDKVYDYGPVSLKSCRDRAHVLSLDLYQKVGDSISVSLSGSGSLQQRFYVKRDINPSDADNLLYRGEFSLRAPYRKFSVGVNGKVSRDETINIDSTLSSDNRIENKYQLGPTLRMQPARWLSLTQDYNVKIEFTDFVNTEDNNYLNRTTTMNTGANFNIFRSLAFYFLYSYLKRDAGSYLMRTGGRRYSPTNETFEHSLNLNVKYEVIKDFSVKAENNFRIQRGNVFGTRNGRKIIATTTTYESGGMTLGFARTMKFGERGGISLDVAYMRNYGPYITPERKEYWEADSELTLKF